MTIALSPDDHTKLIRILGMLGSDFDGERATAGAMASRMLKDAGIVWSDLIRAHVEIRPQDRPYREPPRRPAWQPRPTPSWYSGQSCQDIAAACLRYPLLLDKFEHELLTEIIRLGRANAEQRRRLTAIAMRLRAAGRAV